MNPTQLIGKIIEISQSNLEITSRFNSILNVISQEMSLEEVLVFTLDSDKRLTCRYRNEKSGLFPLIGDYRSFVGEGVIGGVAQKRVPQHYTSKSVPPRFGCLFYAELDKIIDRYKALAFLPISDDSYLYGVLVALATDRDVLRPEEKIILSILARELSGVLRADNLLLSTKKRISELATLNELGKALTVNQDPGSIINSLVLIAARSLNVDFATINLDKQYSRLMEEGRFTYGRISDDARARLVEAEEEARGTKKPTSASLNDSTPTPDNKPFVIYVAPLLSKEITLGTIAVGAMRQRNHSGHTGDLQFLIQTIANHISSGLENIVLSKRLKNVVQELNNTQKRVIEQEKLRSLGEMTANIAHEIKNPLVIIGGFTKRLSKFIHTDRPENKYIEIILKEVARLEMILNEVLDYAKESPMLTETCSINECVDDVIDILRLDPTWEQIRFAREYSTDLPQILCDFQQIKQVFFNMFMNSYDAMGGKGVITIKTEATTRVDGKAFVTILLSDTGGGVDPNVLENIFNPFFTTKERGTGLGLAISNKIITTHGGTIEVENSAGKGVTFLVHFPVRTNNESMRV